MSEKKLPDKLPVNSFPMCSYEWDTREKAEEYNRLPVDHPKRANVYREWEELNLKAEMD